MRVIQESIEQTLAHQTPEHVRIKQKWLKRNQRHPEQHIDVNKESDREYNELLRQTRIVTDKQYTTQQTKLEIEQQQPEPEIKEMDIGRRMFLEDLIADEPKKKIRTINLW